MQLSAKYQAVLEVISKVFQDQYPADNILKEYLRNRKYIGSKDRKFITNMVCGILFDIAVGWNLIAVVVSLDCCCWRISRMRIWIWWLMARNMV